MSLVNSLTADWGLRGQEASGISERAAAGLAFPGSESPQPDSQLRKPAALILSSPLGEAGSLIPDSHIGPVQGFTQAHLPTAQIPWSVPDDPSGMGPGPRDQSC